MKKSMKSLLAAVLAFACVFAAMPMSAFAAGNTVTFYVNEGDAQTYDVKTFNENDDITLPEPPEKEGFTFEGWIIGKDGDNLIPLPEKMGTDSITAYASWKVNNYTVKYISDGSTVSETSAAYGSDISLTVPNDPSKNDYSFAGWFDESGKNVLSYSTVPANYVTFTARWLKNGNVTYVVDGKTFEEYEVKEGDPIPVPEQTPEKFGHKFIGWTPEIPETMGTEELIFEAQFELDKEFVSYVVGGTVIAGGVIAAIAGINTALITGLAIAGGVIAVIGVSSLVKKSYTVTYKVDGEVYKTYEVKEGKSIPVPETDPEKDGYDFAGWTPDAPDKMPANDLTFEASWSKRESSIPDTGSAKAIGIFASLGAAAALLVLLKKKKDND